MKILIIILSIVIILLSIWDFYLLKELKKERLRRFQEAFMKAFIETVNEHPELQEFPEDLKIPKISCEGLGKYTRKKGE